MSATMTEDARPSRAEDLTLLAIWFAIALASFLSATGRITPDTKLALVHEPVRFIERASSAWDPSAAFGQLQNQAIGYLIPMGTVDAVLRSIGLPIWVTQRLWLVLLLGASLWGAHRFLRALGVGTAVGRVVGATAYTLTPSLLMIATYHGGTALPHVLAPWMLLPLVEHNRHGARRAALRSALAVAVMGGINAASTAAVLPLAVCWFLTREPGGERRRLAAWWLAGLFAATAWWAVPLLVSVRHGLDFTPFTERAWLTTSTQSATDAWRGTGHWLTYIDRGGRVLQPGARGLLLDSWAVAGSVLLVIAGAIGLGRRDAPGRRWLIPAAVLGSLALAAAYTGPGNGGFTSGGLRVLLDGPLVAFRNLHKFSPLVQLPLAVGVAHSVSAIIGRRPTRMRPMIALSAGFVVLAGVSPIVPGRAFLPGSFEEIPPAWGEVAAWADARPDDSRTLLLPGSASADYRWGHPQDEPFGMLASSPWTVRDIIPLGGNGSTRLLDAVDVSLRRARAPVGFVEALRRAGIGRIVVRNDLTPDGDGSPSPATIRAVLRSTPGITIGPSHGDVLDPVDLTRDDLITPIPPDSEPVHQLETYVIDDPGGRLTPTDSTASLAAGGGPEALLALPPELTAGRAVLLADDRGDLPVDTVVATDTARHRDVLFGLIRSNTTATLTEDDVGPFEDEPRDRWPDPDPPPRTFAVLDGAAELTEDDPGGLRAPGDQPFSAFDGNPDTTWVPVEPTVGRRLTVTLDEPTVVPSVTVEVPTVGGRHVARVSVTTESAAGTAEIDAEGRGRATLDDRPTSFVTVEITDVEAGPRIAPVGLRSIDLEGVTIRRPLRTASPSPDEHEPADLAVLDRDRLGTGTIGGSDEDGLLDRLVALTPGPRRLGGEASAVAGEELDRHLDPDVRPTTDDPLVVTGAGWHRLPGHDARAAFDGRSDSFWAVPPDHAPGEGAELRWAEPVRVERIRFEPTDHAAAADPIDVVIGVTVDGERTEHRPGSDGIVELARPVTTDRLMLDLRAGGPSTGRPITIRAIAVDDVPTTVEPIDPDRPVVLACGDGPSLVVDGVTVETELATTVGAVERGEPARWAACSAVTPGGDETRITAPHDEPFRIDTLLVLPEADAAVVAGDRDGDGDGDAHTSGADRTTDGSTAERSIRIDSWTSQERSFEIGPGDAVLVSGTENENGGWTASGMAGLRTVRVDGWRQALLVPASETAGHVTLTYAPNGPFRLGILGGLALVLALAIGALLPPPDRRTRLPTPALRERGLRPGGARALAAITGFLLGGPTVLALVPIEAVHRWRPSLARWIAPAALGVVGVLLLAPIGEAWASTNAAFDRPTQLAAVVAWMAFARGAADPPAATDTDLDGQPAPTDPSGG